MNIYVPIVIGFILYGNITSAQPNNKQDKNPGNNYDKNYEKSKQQLNTVLTSEYKREKTLVKVGPRLYKYEYFNSIAEILKKPTIRIISDKDKVDAIISANAYLYIIEISAKKKYTRKIPPEWCFLNCN